MPHSFGMKRAAVLLLFAQIVVQHLLFLSDPMQWQVETLSFCHLWEGALPFPCLSRISESLQSRNQCIKEQM